MQEHAKIERMMRLMQMLTSNVDYSIDDIATRLDASPRTIYRYMESLVEAGFVIQKTGKRQFRLCTESPFFKDISQLVHFNEEEAYMVSQLIDSIADSNQVKRNLKRKLASVYNFRGMVDSVIERSNSQFAHKLLEAIELKQQVLLKGYSSSNTGKVRDRIVEPFAFTTNYIHVWCYEPESQKNKMFRLSRMEEVNILAYPWNYERFHKAAFIDIFRMSSMDGVTFPVKLELNTRARNLLVEEYLLAERDLTKIGPDCWLLETEVSNYLGVGRFVLGLMADIRVVDTPDLDAYLREYVQKHFLS